MKIIISFLIISSLGFQAINAQAIQKNKYDGLQKLEGMEYSGGITFYIEKKSQKLIAFQNDTIKWEADAVKNCGKRKAKINSVFTTSGNLKVSFGKNKTALINIQNGQVECLAEENKKQDKQDNTEIIFTNKNIIKK